jgi:hypothetical protein
MQIELPDQSRPWRINVPPPRDRYFEIAYMGTTFIAVYKPESECWIIGTEMKVQREEITRWRECSAAQLEALNQQLVSNA